MNGKLRTGLAFAALLGGSLPLAAQVQGTGAEASGAGLGETGHSAGVTNPPAALAVGGTEQAQTSAQVTAAETAVVDMDAAFADWLAAFRLRALAAGIGEPVLEQALGGLRYDPTIIDRDRNQAEHTRQIWDYLDRAVSADRIANGKAALAKHKALFAKIPEKYQIEPEVVAAVWGLETAYGTFRGTLPVISSLATLAFDARRSAYFEKELIEALKILQAGHVDPAEFVGSWAGASGHTQFMPSSFWRSAVDWTGDGRRNLWGEDPADALASAAAYLAKSGWAKGLPWGVEVQLPANFPWEQSGERIRKPLGEWRELGVKAMDGGKAAPQVAAETEVSVLLPAGHEGAAFLIFRNFQVIETYNTADAYVIAIGTLSDQLAGRDGIRGDWPRMDPALGGAEKRELQGLLLARGFDPKGVDGIMGPNTIQAIRDYQKSQALVPDGYASLRLVERLRAEAAAAAGSSGAVPAAGQGEAAPAAGGSAAASATGEGDAAPTTGQGAAAPAAGQGIAAPAPAPATPAPAGGGAAPTAAGQGSGLPSAGSAGGAPVPKPAEGRKPRPPGQSGG